MHQQLDLVAATTCTSADSLILGRPPPPGHLLHNYMHNHLYYDAPGLNHSCFEHCLEDGTVIEDGNAAHANDGEVDELSLGLSLAPAGKRTPGIGSSQLCNIDDGGSALPFRDSAPCSHDHAIAGIPEITNDPYCEMWKASHAPPVTDITAALPSTVCDPDMSMLPHAGIYAASQASLLPQTRSSFSNGVELSYLVHMQPLGKRELQAQKRQHARKRTKFMLEVKQQQLVPVRSKDFDGPIFSQGDVDPSQLLSPTCTFAARTNAGNPLYTSAVQYLACDKMHSPMDSNYKQSEELLHNMMDCYNPSEEFRRDAQNSMRTEYKLLTAEDIEGVGSTKETACRQGTTYSKDADKSTAKQLELPTVRTEEIFQTPVMPKGHILQGAESPTTSSTTQCTVPSAPQALKGEYPSQGGMDVQQLKIQDDITSCSTAADRVADHNGRERPTHEDTPKGAMFTSPSTSNSSETCKAATYRNLPWVSTTGVGPLGKTIRGLMYLEKGSKHVQLICSCHGKKMSPAEFVQHSGSTDISNPERSIVMSAIPPAMNGCCRWLVPPNTL